MWWTAARGLPSPKARAFAQETPTRSAPMRPGPAVTATASRSSKPHPASLRVSPTTSSIRWRWTRAAYLGDDAPIQGVLVLGKDHVAAEGGGRLEEGRRRLVTARLEAQDEPSAHGSVCRRTTTVSTADETDIYEGRPSTTMGTLRSSASPKPRSSEDGTMTRRRRGSRFVTCVRGAPECESYRGGKDFHRTARLFELGPDVGQHGNGRQHPVDGPPRRVSSG